MRYVFFGTPRFAEIVLKGLLDAGMPPIALVTNPDRPAGRKQEITAPLTKQLIAKTNPAIPVLQAEKLGEEFVGTLRVMNPDLFIVAAYAQIIPQAVLDVPGLGTLGVHPSLLPKLRGSSPIQSAILASDSKTGTTIYAMDAKMDHGPIVEQREIPLDPLSTDYLTLEEQLATLGAEMLVAILPNAVQKMKSAKPQDENAATFTKKFATEDGYVDPDKFFAAQQDNLEAAKQVVLKINALSPEPGVWTTQNGKRMKLLKAHLAEGGFKLDLVQFEGGKPQKL